MKPVLHSALFILLGLLAVPHDARAVALEPGAIRVAKVQGTVTIVRETDSAGAPLSDADKALGRSYPPAGTRTPAHEGYMLRQGEAIETGPNSRAILAFSNGTTIIVEPETYLSIAKFLQAPFDPSSVNFVKAKTEPTTSITQMALKKGTIAGDVRKLNQGSKMDVETPVGTAGIRGTKFVITISAIAPDGSFTGSLSVTEGTVSFGGTSVTAGNSLSIGGTLGQAWNPTDPSALTEAELQALLAILNQIVDANLIWTSPDATSTSSPGGTPFDWFLPGGDPGGSASSLPTPGGAGGGGGGGGGGGEPAQTGGGAIYSQ